jgi:hypothetical protein
MVPSLVALYQGLIYHNFYDLKGDLNYMEEIVKNKSL